MIEVSLTLRNQRRKLLVLTGLVFSSLGWMPVAAAGAAPTAFSSIVLFFGANLCDLAISGEAVKPKQKRKLQRERLLFFLASITAIDTQIGRRKYISQVMDMHDGGSKRSHEEKK